MQLQIKHQQKRKGRKTIKHCKKKNKEDVIKIFVMSEDEVMNQQENICNSEVYDLAIIQNMTIIDQISKHGKILPNRHAYSNVVHTIFNAMYTRFITFMSILQDDTCDVVKELVH
eukprot:15645_1